MARRGLLAAALCVTAACDVGRGFIRIDGSPGVAPLIEALAREHMMLTTYSVTMGAGLGSRARLDAVQQGSIDIAMASHGVDSSDLRERGLVAHEVARTAVVFAVNASVPVTSLSREQLCDIYSGRKPAWQLFGAPAGAIAPFMRPANEVDAEVALEGIACLRGLKYGGYVSIRERADEMAQAIATTTGAIGLTSMTYVQQSGVGVGGVGRMRALALDGVAPTAENVATGSYPLTRRAMLVTKASPSRTVRSFLMFVRSGDGAHVIRANGAAPAPNERR